MQPENCTAFPTKGHPKLRWAYPSMKGWVEPSMAHVLNGEAAPSALPCYWHNEDAYIVLAQATEVALMQVSEELKRVVDPSNGEVTIDLPPDGVYRSLLPWVPSSLKYYPRESLHYVMPLIDRYWTGHSRNKVVAGTFVEIGGYDGSTMSNTRVLERNFGWSGVLVEGQQNFITFITRVIGKGVPLFLSDGPRRW